MSAYDESQGPEGYDVSNVEAWVRDNVSDLTPPFKWVRLQGGHSNLTYALTDAEGREAVIRRPREGSFYESARHESRVVDHQRIGKDPCSSRQGDRVL